jgi:hypothetical protein
MFFVPPIHLESCVFAESGTCRLIFDAMVWLAAPLWKFSAIVSGNHHQ